MLCYCTSRTWYLCWQVRFQRTQTKYCHDFSSFPSSSAPSHSIVVAAAALSPKLSTNVLPTTRILIDYHLLAVRLCSLRCSATRFIIVSWIRLRSPSPADCRLLRFVWCIVSGYEDEIIIMGALSGESSARFECWLCRGRSG